MLAYGRKRGRNLSRHRENIQTPAALIDRVREGVGGLKGGGRRDARSWWALVEDHSRPGWKEGEARKVKMAA